jgi:hypothetical protein
MFSVQALNWYIIMCRREVAAVGAEAVVKCVIKINNSNPKS